MRFYFHPDADAEFDKVVDYYEECQPGLGIEFAEEVYATIARIIAYPRALLGNIDVVRSSSSYTQGLVLFFINDS